MSTTLLFLQNFFELIMKGALEVESLYHIGKYCGVSKQRMKENDVIDSV